MFVSGLTSPLPPSGPVTSVSLIRGEYIYDHESPSRRVALERWNARTEGLMRSHAPLSTHSNSNGTCEVETSVDEDVSPSRYSRATRSSQPVAERYDPLAGIMRTAEGLREANDTLTSQLNAANKLLQQRTEETDILKARIKQLEEQQARTPPKNDIEEELPAREGKPQDRTQERNPVEETVTQDEKHSNSFEGKKPKVQFSQEKKKLNPEQHRQLSELYDGLCMMSSCVVKKVVIGRVLHVEGVTLEVLLRGLQCGVSGAVSSEDLEEWMAALPDCTAFLDWMSDEVQLILDEENKTESELGLPWLKSMMDIEGPYALPGLCVALGRKLPTIEEYTRKVRQLEGYLEDEKLRCELYERRAAFADAARSAPSHDTMRSVPRRQSAVSLKDQVSVPGEATELDTCMALLRGSLKDLKTDAGGLALLTRSAAEEDDDW